MSAIPIDLHIELSSLKNFINSQIEQRNPYLFYGKELFEVLKRVTIDSEIKPFLTFPKYQNEQPYYDNYQKRSNEQFDKLIPDFFEYEGEFYDLERIQYVYKDFTRAQDFETLFIIKLLELKSNDYSISEFLSFQQFDSFYGQKESIDSFLYQLTAKDSNCRLLSETLIEIKNWLKNERINQFNEKQERNTDVAADNIHQIETNISQEKWDNQIMNLREKDLPCKWSIEKILHYFSFLYLELSENGEPYISKEDFDRIFENGFRIPTIDIKPLIKLNCTARFPLKNITYGIYQFYHMASQTNYDKKPYFLFFASYIEDYAKIKASPLEYSSFSKNATKAKSPINKIDWSKYCSFQ
jgi:hypothetical protein